MSRTADAALAVAGVAVIGFSGWLLIDARDPLDEAAGPRATSSSSPTVGDEGDPAASDRGGRADEPAVVLVLGDEAGTANGANQPWLGMLRDELDVVVVNRSRKGAGYITDGPPETCKVDSCSSMSTMARMAIEQEFEADVILVVGGVADLGNPDIEVQDIVDFYRGLADNFPDAEILALGPFALGDRVPESLDIFTRTVRAEVREVGGTYVEVGQPYLEARDAQRPPDFDAGTILARGVVDALSADYAS